MDSNNTEINTSELVLTGVGNDWRHSVFSTAPLATGSVLTAPVSPLGLIKRPLDERRSGLGLSLIELPSSCPQVARGQQISNQCMTEHHVDAMGGSYAADDIFGARWESRLGRPPE